MNSESFYIFIPASEYTENENVMTTFTAETENKLNEEQIKALKTSLAYFAGTEAKMIVTGSEIDAEHKRLEMRDRELYRQWLNNQPRESLIDLIMEEWEDSVQ